MKTSSTSPTDGEASVSAAAARVAEFANLLTAVTGVMGGQITFRQTKLSAALHEAGHAVILVLDGIITTSVGIQSISDEGRQQWLGYVDAPSAGGIDSETPAMADIKCAQKILAGIVSEGLFDPGYREGSSIDEIGGAQAFIKMAASKLQRDDKALWSETLMEVKKILKANEPIVRKIAAELMRKGTIRSRRLAYFLRSVRRVSDEA
jgi:hypothetical protein